MQVLASLVDAPETLELRYFRTLSLVIGSSSPVLFDGGVNAVYVGPDWNLAEAKAFAAIRHGMPEPTVYDWDDALIGRVLARSTGDASADDLDHSRRL